MAEMKDYLTDIDDNKLKIIFEVKEAYNSGTITLAEGRQRLKNEVGKVKPYEIAFAEQKLKAVDALDCQKEDIQKMLELFDEILDTSDPNLDPAHPISYYLRENSEMKKLLLAAEDLVQYPVIKNQWIELYEKIERFKIHLSRKQNQLYSILERKGFDRPTTMMWTLDNFIRDEISEVFSLLSSDREDEFISMQKTIIEDVRDLMQKEETILYPTSLAMIIPREFEEMKAGDREIGFSWEEADTKRTGEKEAQNTNVQVSAFAGELAQLLNKHGLTIGADTKVEVATGSLTLEQINLIYKHMPVDISYVDENELVCFYSDTKHRVFPRSKNVIGRDVKNCHPRGSVHIVEEIIEKFRKGEQDTAEFWINKPGLFIYIYYVAVRDENGKFRGVLEMMQDCTHIRSLNGSKTLLTWDGEGQHIPENEEKGEPGPKMDVDKIVPTTRLSHLLTAYPHLKNELPQINEKFAMINSAMAKAMLPVVTIQMMSERAGMDVNELMEKIRQAIRTGKDV